MELAWLKKIARFDWPLFCCQNTNPATRRFTSSPPIRGLGNGVHFENKTYSAANFYKLNSEEVVYR